MASSVQSTDKRNTQASSSVKLVVAAIDFGTTFTGFAFSLKGDPNKILTSKWSGQNLRTATEKAPTCVLFSPEKELVAFGYEAEEKFSQLVEDDNDSGTEKANKYYFFERFKMKLYLTKKLNRHTTLSDTLGKEMLALDVFAKVIGYMKNCLEQELKTIAVGIQEDDILWVLTVPAIWSDSAKQFMKEAAEQAGILSKCIRLVLEPEAGSLYCNTMPLCTVAKIDGSTQIEEFPVGQKYIVADLGGGTADISVHEIIEDRNLREIYRSDGGPYGGSMVDTEFVLFLESIFGEKVVKFINDRYYDKVLDLRHEFETKKRTFKAESTEFIKIRIPYPELTEALEKGGERSVDSKIERAKEKYGDKVMFKAGKLFIAPEIMASFFKRPAEEVTQLIKNIRKEDEVGEINALLMVGGFSESKYLQEIIKKCVPGLRIIVPPETSLAVLKGAVMLGYNHRIITERIARYTYGFSFAIPFEQGKHPEELKIIEPDRVLCSSVFDKMITKGEVLKVGNRYGAVAAHRCSNIFDRIMPLVIDLYRSEETDPQYTADGHGCELVGLMFLFPPSTGWPDASVIAQQLVVGESEFTVMGSNLQSGSEVEGKLDFLTLKTSGSANLTE